MNFEALNLGTDGNCVLRYFSNFPDLFISESEIARRADGKARYLKDPHWPHIALAQLIELKVLETDGGGKYRLKSQAKKAGKPANKFIDPKLRAVLERSGRKLDLSDYA